MNKLIVLVILLSLTICQISQAVPVSLAKIKLEETSGSFETFFPTEKQYKQIIKDFIGTINTNENYLVATYSWHVFQIDEEPISQEFEVFQDSKKLIYKFPFIPKNLSSFCPKKYKQVPEISTLSIFGILFGLYFLLRRHRWIRKRYKTTVK